MNKSGNHQATKMLNYECANSSAIMFNGDGGAGGGLEELISQAIQTKDNFAHHSLNDTTTVVTTPINPNDVVFHNHELILNNPNFFDPGVDCVYPTSPNSSLLSLETDQAGFVLMPKLQPYDCNVNFNNSLNLIELNLDGRIYFYSGDDEFLNQLGLIRSTSTPLEAGLTNSPKCQVEGCNADLAHARHYHRRHKVCEFHSKASTVFTAGLTQRYCQQCSRFHVLSEFDEGKRSCRKRLADHNRRRRKASHNINEAPKLINDQPLEMVSDPPYL